MLGFKEYALLTFDYCFAERTRNHFLKYIGPDLFLYLYDRSFLLSLTDKEDCSRKGTEYFIGEINKAGSIYNELYNKFRSSAGIAKKIKYYRLAAFYLKLNGLALNKVQSTNATTESDNAIKEIFAEKLYDYLLAINSSATSGGGGPTSKTGIKKTFVPDHVILDHKADKSPIYAPGDSLLYENNTTTFEGRMFTVKTYKCDWDPAALGFPAGYKSFCGDHSPDHLWKNPATDLLEYSAEQMAKFQRLEDMVKLYKQNDNIEKTVFPNSDGFPYKYLSFISNNLGKWKENQFRIDRHESPVTGITKFPSDYATGLPTTKETTFLKLFSEGAYVEYFFKFDFDELINNMASNEAYKQTLYELFNSKNYASYKLLSLAQAISPEAPLSSPSEKYNSVLYHSLDSFSRIVKQIYFRVPRESWAMAQHHVAFPPTSLPTSTEIDEAFRKTKIEFGARLVISTPNLPNETNSDKIGPVYSLDTYESKFDSDKLTDGGANHGITDAHDKILTDVLTFSKSDPPPPQSAWQNKTFIYNFLQKKEKLAGSFSKKDYSGDLSWATKRKYNKETQQYEVYLDDITVIPAYSFPIAESAIELTSADKKEFLYDFYVGIPRYDTWQKTSVEMQGLDFSLDQAVVGKYSQTILDDLFENKTVKQFIGSALVGQSYAEKPEVYKKAILNAPTSSNLSLFEDANDTNKEHQSFITSCDNVDNIIDQNLITLVDSIEGF